MEQKLQVGDVIQAWELEKNKFGTYYIKKVLKKVAICDRGHRFKIDIDIHVNKPSNEYIGEVKKVIPYMNRRFFVLKRKED